jgi:hypothetical protein
MKFVKAIIVLLVLTFGTLPMWFMCWSFVKYRSIDEYKKHIGGESPFLFYGYSCLNNEKNLYM